MTKRIFYAICFASIAVFAASLSLFTYALYTYFSGIQKNELKAQTDILGTAVSDEGLGFLDELNSPEYRITWIDSDGKVLFDNRANPEEMENHLEREEIKEALASGSGESSRYSSTLTERFFYYAKRLPNGTVLRLSATRSALPMLLLGMSQAICLIVALTVIVSLLLAFHLSHKIIEPLNGLDLEEPLHNKGYDEIAPLLERINSQQQKIESQKQRLNQMRQEFDAVTENMSEAIVLLNPTGLILGFNRAAQRLFGLDEDSIGSPFVKVSPAIKVESLLKKCQSGQRAQKTVSLTDRKYQINVSPVLVEGEASGCVLLALDVTEKERTDQIRREFTANVSHELKTPLHIIAGSAELLKSGMVKEEDYPEFYSRILDESQRMTHLVEDIIRLSHLDEGAEDWMWEEVDLGEVAQSTIESLSSEAERMGVAFKLQSGSVSLYGVRQLLESIVYNLCENAVKYNRPQGEVSVEITEEDGQVVLKVSDTGIGIPYEHQERIFERFYRVDKSRSKELGGTGLGLSIVKHAVILHRGEVGLTSVPEAGTTVTVVFPR